MPYISPSMREKLVLNQTRLGLTDTELADRIGITARRWTRFLQGSECLAQRFLFEAYRVLGMKGPHSPGLPGSCDNTEWDIAPYYPDSFLNGVSKKKRAGGVATRTLGEAMRISAADIGTALQVYRMSATVKHAAQFPLVLAYRRVDLEDGSWRVLHLEQDGTYQAQDLTLHPDGSPKHYGDVMIPKPISEQKSPDAQALEEVGAALEVLGNPDPVRVKDVADLVYSGFPEMTEPAALLRDVQRILERAGYTHFAWRFEQPDMPFPEGRDPWVSRNPLTQQELLRIIQEREAPPPGALESEPLQEEIVMPNPDTEVPLVAVTQAFEEAERSRETPWNGFLEAGNLQAQIARFLENEPDEDLFDLVLRRARKQVGK